MSATFDPEIDYQYRVSRWSSRKDTMDIFVKRCTQYTEDYIAEREGKIETVNYGDLGPRQVMDIFYPDDLKEDSPILVFIHGGFWVVTRREMYGFAVKQAVKKGWIGVVVGYDQAPAANLTTIVQEIQDSYVFLSQKFPQSREMVWTGHSAGGHLAAMMLSTNWKTYCPSVDRLIPITRCIPLSGALDLRPIIHMSFDEQLQLTQKEIHDLSPVLHIESALENIKSCGIKVTCVVAEDDPPKLKEISKFYIEALKAHDIGAKYVEIKGTDHFELVEGLVDDEYELNRLFFEE